VKLLCPTGTPGVGVMLTTRFDAKCDVKLAVTPPFPFTVTVVDFDETLETVTEPVIVHD